MPAAEIICQNTDWSLIEDPLIGKILAYHLEVHRERTWRWLQPEHTCLIAHSMEAQRKLAVSQWDRTGNPIPSYPIPVLNFESRGSPVFVLCPPQHIYNYVLVHEILVP